ncbi:SAP domain containing protein [Euroglyphus maynei]|uniref:SAP domain containing protein n=1 Tax=Euroglyphus maynei TaxID=6958 RepID=A0A1Y3BAH0_EURMA|nr:SAP domain containing protein [Euroglyphus maynei]
MDFSSLNHLKVADLKQHLRQRGLVTTGNKTELIQRLGQALMKDSGLVIASESNLTPQTTQSSTILPQHQQSSHHLQTNVSKISNHNEIDEDAILGGDDDDDVDDDEASASELIDKIPNEDLLLSDHTPSTIATSMSSETEQKSNTMIKQTSAATASKNSSNPVVVVSKPTTTASIPSLKQLATKISSVPLTSEERKRMRQLKFADPKLVNRVQRFGAQQSSLQKLIEPSEDGKLLKRVERFGEAVSSKAKTLDEIERLERRKERFAGNVTMSTNKVSVVTNSSGSQVPENIRKRQDRFGVIDKPEPTSAKKPLQTPNNSFKRRRFAY